MVHIRFRIVENVKCEKSGLTIGNEMAIIPGNPDETNESAFIDA